MSESTAQPIIVIKKKGGHGGHHGGAWKVAYADFVTAMMSLFIVLWLMNSTPQVKKAIAGYFNDPRGTSRQMGTDVLGDGPSVVIDKTTVEKLKEQIKKAIVKQKELDKLKDQIELKMTNEGLRIELIDGKNGTFYESGSTKLNQNGEELLALLAGQLKDLPNKLLIEGHTDSKPIGDSSSAYTNWELSSDRANSVRRLLQQDGVGEGQITQVRGFADQSLRNPKDPTDPSNRRISLIVQFEEAPAGTVGPETLDNGGGKPKEGAGEGKEAASVEAARPEGKSEAKPEGGKSEAAPAAKPPAAAPAAAPTAAPATPARPVDVKPSAGKIDLPPIPAKLAGKIEQMKQMKSADAAGHPK